MTKSIYKIKETISESFFLDDTKRLRSLVTEQVGVGARN